MWLNETSLVAEGPRAVGANAKPLTGGAYAVSVVFSGRTAPFFLAGTRNCTACCKEGGGAFDVSVDGATWVNGTNASIVCALHMAYFIALNNHCALASCVLRYCTTVDTTQVRNLVCRQ